MPESGPFGSVRGVCSNAHPYRDAERLESIAAECPALVWRNGRLGVGLRHWRAASARNTVAAQSRKSTTQALLYCRCDLSAQEYISYRKTVVLGKLMNWTFHHKGFLVCPEAWGAAM
jgi:hypothetical protein